MKKSIAILMLMLRICVVSSAGSELTRLIVCSDIGGSDPDDQQSFVHLLVSLDMIDLEGFIYQHAWDSYNNGNEIVVTDAVMKAYGEVLPNLRIHGGRFPDETVL